MSKDTSSGLVAVERIFGAIIAIVGTIVTYYTYNNISTAGIGANLFFVIGIMLIITGLVLTVARIK